MKAAFAPTLGVFLAALALTSCGGGDEGSEEAEQLGGTREERATAIVEEAIDALNSGDCGHLYDDILRNPDSPEVLESGRAACESGISYDNLDLGDPEPAVDPDVLELDEDALQVPATYEVDGETDDDDFRVFEQDGQTYIYVS